MFRQYLVLQKFTNSFKVPLCKIFKQETTSVAVIAQLSRRLGCIAFFFQVKINFFVRLFKLRLSKVLALETEMCFREKLQWHNGDVQMGLRLRMQDFSVSFKKVSHPFWGLQLHYPKYCCNNTKCKQSNVVLKILEKQG